MIVRKENNNERNIEVLKEQLKALEDIVKNNRTEPELQFDSTAAMVQIATVMADIAKKACMKN